jgi:hypothetical protein
VQLRAVSPLTERTSGTKQLNYRRPHIWAMRPSDWTSTWSVAAIKWASDEQTLAPTSCSTTSVRTGLSSLSLLPLLYARLYVREKSFFSPSMNDRLKVKWP